MALFSSTQDLFEIMPRGTSQETREGLEQQLKELLSLEGKTIVVVDEIPDPVEGGIPDEFTIRKDTAIVLVIAVIVALGVSFLAGRATVRGAQPTTPVTANPASVQPEQANKPALPDGVFDPHQRVTEPFVPQQQPNPAPLQAPIMEQPAVNPTPAAPQRTAVKRKYQLPVVTSTPEKAAKVVEYLNTNPASPIARRPDLCAVIVGSGSVRIRGFEEKEPALKQAIDNMKDPTGGGRLGGAPFWREK